MDLNNTTLDGCLLVRQLQHPDKKMLLVGLYVTAAVNLIPALLTVIVNGGLLALFIKTRSLHNPPTVFLGALCLSDLLVGVISQPLYLCIIFTVVSSINPSFSLGLAFFLSMIIFAGMSYILVFYITLDVYFAVCYPFKYERFCTCKRFLLLVAGTWVYKVLPPFGGSLFYIWYYAIFTVITLSIMIACYKRIYLAIREKNRAVVTVGTYSMEEKQARRRDKEDRKKTYTIILLLSAFITCYFPTLVVSVTWFPTISSLRLCRFSPEAFFWFILAMFFLQFNSIINPIVYCIRLTPIRRAILKLLNRRVQVL
ncbi:5-hydroxytryptamine receptor 1D-like [Rhopilema esculentum]|uniref:5-hydroxytryptamine receptor 1D-like n=1 Tax=Rhopilema esculentum TaxID=499914 RepID=UPI0031D5036E|eukprot:gene5934-11281_t